MGNVIQRLTRRSGEFQLTQQVDEAKQKPTPPRITVNDVNSTDDLDIEPNEGDFRCQLFLSGLTSLWMRCVFKSINSRSMSSPKLHKI